ncbi:MULTISPECIES: macro domain-containing protein [Halobacteriovorax]|uniref:Macro domain-containing protein n=1 Tax=Halobacteriovorax vibrionivorans TaxID=2152716 RepID=A0ABY0IIQ8_9BACT|nr:MULTISPECIES: macro domain-containing protein [Halobacteriovorax]AYF43418.1 macro domain protein [Halobacteriovorax sp. BALOs_7]RZF22008.1 macro domain-containing protein [Halobacteriovorax vibrionivorans]TGD46437.1 macro domain-containing protein [Halobacteriovorax sp. Y22]
MKNIQVIKADITTLDVDVIVNAANSELKAGGGVDGAIHAACGEELEKELSEMGGCPVGEARLTKAFNIPAEFIIHAVGPKWEGGNNGESALLEKCYIYALSLAQENECKSIAFPCISTGIFGYPKIEAAITATSAVKSFDGIDSFDDVIFCCFDDESYEIYQTIL